MARPRELTADQEALLKQRIHLSRTIHVFSIRQLTDGWKISLSTLNRYSTPEYRALSQRVARTAYIRAQRTRIQAGYCTSCANPLPGHPRCKDCTILLHNVKTPLCTSCFDTQERTKMKLYGIQKQSSNRQVRADAQRGHNKPGNYRSLFIGNC